MLELLRFIIEKYQILVVVTYILFILMATWNFYKRNQAKKTSFDGRIVDYQTFEDWPVSVIVPVYNESQGVVENILSLLRIKYPKMEIIIVNDGSTDETVDIIIDRFKMVKCPIMFQQKLKTQKVRFFYQSTLYPMLVLVDKENGGKGDALNAGINVSRYDYFCSLDGDSVLDEHAISYMMEEIVQSNGEVYACGGNIRLANEYLISSGAVSGRSIIKSPWLLLQINEYIRSFMLSRPALESLGILLLLSGACSIFNRQAIIEIGGYSTKTLGEDLEIVVRLMLWIRKNKIKGRLAYRPDAVCYTEAPESMRVLGRQRRRWSQGLLETLWKHKYALFNPRYKEVGLVSLVYYLVFEAGSVILIVFNFLLLILSFFKGAIYFEYSVLLLVFSALFNALYSLVGIYFQTFTFKENYSLSYLTNLIVATLVEGLIYQPLNAFWRIQGFVGFITKRQSWGKMERRGFSNSNG